MPINLIMFLVLIHTGTSDKVGKSHCPSSHFLQHCPLPFPQCHLDLPAGHLCSGQQPVPGDHGTRHLPTEALIRVADPAGHEGNCGHLAHCVQPLHIQPRLHPQVRRSCELHNILHFPFGSPASLTVQVRKGVRKAILFCC